MPTVAEPRATTRFGRSLRKFAATIALAARPRVWLANLLVFAAPGAAGVLTSGSDLVATLAAFFALCLATCGGFLIDEVVTDGPEPRHQGATVAGRAGRVPALTMAAALVAAAVGLSAAVNAELLIVVGGFVVVSLAYSLGLRRVPILELGALAAGYLLRAVAGAAAVDVELTNWFLIVATAGSVLALASQGSGGYLVRGSDLDYPEPLLAYVRAVAATVATTAYCIWAFEEASLGESEFLVRLSIVPFVIALLRFSFNQGRFGSTSPIEFVVLQDHVLVVVLAVWVATLAVAVHA